MTHGVLDTAQAATALADKVRASKLPPPEERARIRRAARATLRDFADVLGVNAMTVCRWEAGSVQPRLEHAIAYRRLLDQIRAATDESASGSSGI